jgi:hypothetical protein
MNGGSATRHLRWLAGAAVAVLAVVLAVVTPSSPWGALFAVGVCAAMVAARPVVRASYAPGWTRSVVVVTAGAVCAGGCYAFSVGPWGPLPVVAIPLGVVLVLGMASTVADAMPSGGRRAGYVAKMEKYKEAQRRHR